MSKFSKSLQTKQLDFSVNFSLIDAVLHALNDANTPAAYWILELLDRKDDLQQVTGEIVSADKIHTFKETVETQFVILRKTFCVCTGHDPHNVPSNDSSQIPTYGKKLTEVLLNHNGKNKFALTLNDVEKV